MVGSSTWLTRLTTLPKRAITLGASFRGIWMIWLTFNLDVSQIIHIPRNDAPKVIARFGSVVNLVSQVLEPTIGNYFRNAAQGSDVISFLKERQSRQKDARDAISKALEEYNVGAVDTLIGDITPPESLMKTLTDRKIAEQETVTFETQRKAQEIRQQLQQATAMADTQAKVVDSERSVTIAEFQAKAPVKQAEGLAQAKTVQATADAMVVNTVGQAEATKVKAIVTAESDASKLKITSMDAGNHASVQVPQTLAGSKIPIVPNIMVSGSAGNGQGGTLVDVLLANLLTGQLKEKSSSAAPAPESPPPPPPARQ